MLHGSACGWNLGREDKKRKNRSQNLKFKAGPKPTVARRGQKHLGARHRNNKKSTSCLLLFWASSANRHAAFHSRTTVPHGPETPVKQTIRRKPAQSTTTKNCTPRARPTSTEVYFPLRPRSLPRSKRKMHCTQRARPTSTEVSFPHQPRSLPRSKRTKNCTQHARPTGTELSKMTKPCAPRALAPAVSIPRVPSWRPSTAERARLAHHAMRALGTSART